MMCLDEGKLLANSVSLINEAVSQYKVDVVYGLFSGGHDSLTSTHLASRHELFRGVIHIDTGTGIPETRQFVEQTCQEHGWNLIIVKPATTYEMLITKYGFPSPQQHTYMYRYLKERPLMQAVKGIRATTNATVIGLASGVRHQESVIRMHRKMEVHKDGVKVFIPVIRDASALEVGLYIKENNLSRNPVKDLLHISGECLCGSFASFSEYKDISMWFPKVGARIKRWESLVSLARENQVLDQEAGLTTETPVKQAHCRWGHRTTVAHEQQDFLHLCHSCDARFESAENDRPT